jgi:dihydrofolate reductase
MRKLVVSAWITLDGVFDADTMDQWFNPYDNLERQEYIREGILACSAIIFGRKTYEMLAPYWSSLKNNEMGIAGKLNSVPKYVVSSTLKSADWQNSTIISENVVVEITRLKQLSGQELQIEGSAALVQSLAAADLIDEYRFLVHPVIMGSGKRFFREGTKATLKLIESRSFSTGVVSLRYQPDKKEL